MATGTYRQVNATTGEHFGLLSTNRERWPDLQLRIDVQPGENTGDDLKVA